MKKLKVKKLKLQGAVPFEGTIQPLTSNKPFYMVVVEGSHNAPTIKHEKYLDAFDEMLRLSKKENKKAYVLMSLAQVEQIPNITNFDIYE